MTAPQIPRWSIADAVAVLARIEVVAQRNGYKCALAGSVAHAGAGRDLDVWLSRKRPREFCNTAPRLLTDIRMEFDAEYVRDGGTVFHTSMLGDLSVVIQLSDGRLVDLWVLGAEDEQKGRQGFDAPLPRRT